MMKEFLEAINNKLILQITFNSKEKGIIKRTCIPFDFGPSRKYKDGLDRYHFLDLDSPDGKHNLSILPDQVLNMTLTNNNFNPADYISWTPNWHISRDWGEFS